MREKVTVRQWVIVLAVMVSARLFAETIKLEPDAAKRRTVVIHSQGMRSASLYLDAPSPWKIGGSSIIASDTMLWRAQNVTPNNSTHIYQLVNAYSSQEYVLIAGNLTQPGSGGTERNPTFSATVPSVDIDWVDHSGANHEADEDSWVGVCPFATNNAQRTQIIVRKLKDDRSLVTGSMTFHFRPTTVVRFLKADGSVLADGATISDNMTPLTLYVDPIDTGRFTVELKGPVDDEFNRPSDYLSGVAVKVEVKKVVFSSDHGVLTDYNATYAGSGGSVYTPRGWVKNGENNPITHRQGQKITANVTVCVQPSGLKFNINGSSDVGALIFSKPGLISNGGDQTISIESAFPLSSSVDVLNGRVGWSFVVDHQDEVYTINGGVSGSHKIYVTRGTPGSGPTLKRISLVCDTCQFLNSPENIADCLHDYVSANTVFSGSGNERGWALLDGGSGDCDNQASCMKAAVEMLGAGPATVSYVRASTNAGAGNCLDLKTRIVNNKKQYLLLDFDAGVGHNWNAYEGCCKVGSNYYAITPKIKAGNDYEMLKALGCQQYWVETMGIPGQTLGWKVVSVLEEVPIP